MLGGLRRLQGELAIKNSDLAVAARSAEAMLHEISASTAVAEKEKSKVAVIVSDVSNTAAARARARCKRMPNMLAALCLRQISTSAAHTCEVRR